LGVDKFKIIDVLILNAGISGSIMFEKIKDLNIFEKMMKTNYLGYVYFTYFSLPYLKKAKNPRIGVGKIIL
jgi:NAD(P)-dependent dehydrogenase (short-subunit alcohol dehydrogenase family)